jgi:pimeloyl-ACP methyl ester carboxylesterase
MKKIIFSLILLVFLNLSYSQSLNSVWSGILNAGGQKIELRLHLIQNEDKTYSSNWDVPLQKAIGIVSSKTDLVNSQLNIEIKAIAASYSGKMNAEANKIQGTWTQAGHDFELNMEPYLTSNPSIIESKPPAPKPQTPKPPFSYLSKDIIYEGAKTKLTYGATLTYPTNPSKFPLVILITGSGRQDRDETIFNHKPFAVIADDLTKKGYAVLRVDDRGTDKSTGNFIESTTEDFAQDVEEHIRYAKTLPMIDTNKIGLCGHSEGGLIAPLVASRNKSVAFIILMAGPGIKITELMALQNEAVLKSVGVGQNEIDSYLPLYKNLMKLVTQSTDQKMAIEKSKELTSQWFKSTNKDFVLATTNISTEADIDKYVGAMVGQLSTKWWKYFANYDPQPTLQKVKCPVLAINGGADIQSVADQNLKGIQNSLLKGGNKKATIMKFDGLNHLFQKCTKCSVNEYGELETTIEPVVLEYISNWLKNII